MSSWEEFLSSAGFEDRGSTCCEDSKMLMSISKIIPKSSSSSSAGASAGLSGISSGSCGGWEGLVVVVVVVVAAPRYFSTALINVGSFFLLETPSSSLRSQLLS